MGGAENDHLLRPWPKQPWVLLITLQFPHFPRLSSILPSVYRRCGTKKKFATILKWKLTVDVINFYGIIEDLRNSQRWERGEFDVKWVACIENELPERILYIFVCVKLEELALKVVLHALFICNFFSLLMFFQLLGGGGRRNGRGREGIGVGVN